MPIEVRCVCGNVFTVDDESAGSRATCQACGSAVAVPKRVVSPEEGARLLREMLDALERHAADPESIERDHKLGGGLLASGTYSMIALMLVGIIVYILGLTMYADLRIVSVIGFLLALLAGAVALAMAVVDYRMAHIGDVETAVKAFKRYFKAIRERRWRKAFTALAPSARTVEKTEPLIFETVPSERTTYSISDADSLGKYWDAFHKGPKGHFRSIGLKHVHQLFAPVNGLAFVKADFAFASSSKWNSILTSLHPVGMLFLPFLQTKEKRTIVKLMVRRHGKWYVAEAELEGALDRIALREE